MNPQHSGQGSGQGINDVSGELLPAINEIGDSSSVRRTSEIASAAPELAQTGNSQMPVVTSSVTDISALADPGQQISVGPTPQPAAHIAAPTTAEDADLIEKEWVLRAKALVAKTKDDPHQQNKELNLYKADYIKKRYNKDVKVSEA